MLSRGGKFLKNLLFPPACPGCGCYVSTEAEWCEDCRRNLLHPRFLDDSRRNRLDGCYALCDYSEPVQRALTHLKYKRKRQYGRAFSDLLEAFPFTRRLEMYDAVVPVPLYPLKERERGFNQNGYSLPFVGPKTRLHVATCVTTNSADRFAGRLGT